MFEQQCKNCKCNDGVIKCDPIECPQLSCSEDKQIRDADGCCSYCIGNNLKKKVIHSYPINPFYFHMNMTMMMINRCRLLCTRT